MIVESVQFVCQPGLQQCRFVFVMDLHILNVGPSVVFVVSVSYISGLFMIFFLN